MRIERWQAFSKHDQMLHIGAAILRAAVAQDREYESFTFAIKEAMNLLELTLKDPKWANQSYMLTGLKSELNSFLAGARKENIKILYQAL